MTKTFTAYMEYDPETGLYVGTIPSVPGAHSQGATLDELQSNLREVLELCLDEAWPLTSDPGSDPTLGSLREDYEVVPEILLVPLFQ